ncbi:MAG: hypothetical protein FWD57_16050, partial [Polyangiaceae bacterium]|nr:hypothetical protein [Polyangiaceae bacterium]
RGAKNPSNQCESCEAASTTSWTPSAAEGSACGGGKFCNASRKCVDGCAIGGKYYEIGATAPGNSCKVCNAAVDSGAWTPNPALAVGDVCNGGGKYCSAEYECRDGCKSGSEVYWDGDTSPGNECLYCDAGLDKPSGWYQKEAGASCNNGICDKDGDCMNPTTISAGAMHSCGIMSDGRAKCWGSNEYGGLGVDTGGAPGPWTPWLVPEAFGLVYIGAGNLHTCAATAAGKVLCWGDNSVAQLGRGTVSGVSTTPQEVSGLSGIKMLSVGSFHNCVITAEDHLRCWGNNADGQLGIGTIGNYASSPTQVLGSLNMLKVSKVSAGRFHTCAILSSGDAYCWGYNSHGGLGDGTTEPKLFPSLVNGAYSTGFTAISAGAFNTCGIRTSGTTINQAVCWGMRNGGATGDGTTAEGERTQPYPVVDHDTDVAAITMGANSGCALTDSSGTRRVRCWGAGAAGQIGNGSVDDTGTPDLVLGLTTNVTALPDMRWASVCVIDSGNVPKCWGLNDNAQLGQPYHHGPDEGESTALTVVGFP